MKTMLLWLLAGVIGLAAPASGEAETLLTVKVGEPFQISVTDISGGTGYETVVRARPPWLALVSTELKRPEKPRPGAPAVKIFTFVAERSGRGRLEINAARMWEHPLQWLHQPGDETEDEFFYRIRAVK